MPGVSSGWHLILQQARVQPSMPLSTPNVRTPMLYIHMSMAPRGVTAPIVEWLFISHQYNRS